MTLGKFSSASASSRMSLTSHTGLCYTANRPAGVCSALLQACQTCRCLYRASSTPSVDDAVLTVRVGGWRAGDHAEGQPAGHMAGGLHGRCGAAEAGGHLPVLAPLAEPQEAGVHQVLPDCSEPATHPVLVCMLLAAIRFPGEGCRMTESFRALSCQCASLYELTAGQNRLGCDAGHW